MDPSTERRNTRRLFLGPDYSICFIIKGHAFYDVRITNVSLGGCFAMVPRRDSALFNQGAILEQLSFEHPDLPRGSITAQVCYAIGTQVEQSGLEYMGIGINFVIMNPEIHEHLSLFLEAMLEA